MNLFEKRKDNAELIRQNRFIRNVLETQGESINQAQTEMMTQRGFSTNDFFTSRKFDVTDNKLSITVLKKHRFVDMKTRQTRAGKIQKKNHPIYNRIIYGHLSNIVREISYGYTDAVIAEMKKLEN